MSQTQDEAVQASAQAAKAAQEETLPDGHGGVITRTAPSTSGTSYAGGIIVENDVGDSPEALMAAIEETIKPFGDGDLVSGSIVKIDKDEVLLDIGYKSEGVIPVRELSIRNDVDPGEVVSIGDEIEALVLQKEDADGRLILSKKRAQYERAWGNIEEIKNLDGTVEGPVIEVVKGGLILDIGLRGFLPASLVEMRRVRDLLPYVGKRLECRIIELDRNRNNVVLSRRKFLEESQAEQRQEFLTSLDKGEIRTGTVSSIVNFGAFVDLGGVDGLVHVSELSWKHVDHPSEVVEVGQEVKVEVLDVDLERERVSLSLKATQEDPWRQFARKHEVSEIIEGRVTKLVPFGAFVELDNAIEGLVHISELAEHHVERAEDEVKVHDRIPVKIIDIDLDRRRISLSRKQGMAAADEGAATDAGTEPEPEIALEPDAEIALEPEPEIALEPDAEIAATADEIEQEAGVPSEDPLLVPEKPEEILSAAEEAPEIAPEPLAPEVALDPQVAAEEAPEEEKEEAALTRFMSPDHSPEGREGVTAAEPDKPNMEVRLLQEESDNPPGTAVEEVVEKEEEDDDTSEDESEGGEALDPKDPTGEESIESIVEDLKRERGQKPS